MSKNSIIHINAVTLALSLPNGQASNSDWLAVKSMWEDDLCLKFYYLLTRQWKEWQGLEMSMLDPQYNADLKVHAQAKFRQVSKEFAANKEQYIIVSQNRNIPLRQEIITKLVARISKEDLDEAIEHYLLELARALKKGNMQLLLTNRSEVDNSELIKNYLNPYILHQKIAPISASKSWESKARYLLALLEKNQLNPLAFKEQLLLLIKDLDNEKEAKHINQFGLLLQEIIKKHPIYKEPLYLRIIKLCSKNAAPFSFESIQEIIDLLNDYPKQATEETARLLEQDCEESYRKNDKKIPETAKILLGDKYLRSAAIDPVWTRAHIDAWLENKTKNVTKVNWMHVVAVLVVLGSIAFGAMRWFDKDELLGNKWPPPPESASEIYEDGQVLSMVEVSKIVKALSRDGSDTSGLKTAFYDLFLDKEAARISVKDDLSFFDGEYTAAALASKLIAGRNQLIVEGTNDFNYDLALLKNPKERKQAGETTDILVFENMSGDKVDAFVPMNWSDTLWLHKTNFQYPPINAAWAIKFYRLSFNLSTRPL